MEKQTLKIIMVITFLILTGWLVVIRFDNSSELKEGEGKEEVLKHCSTCHSVATIIKTKRSREEWKRVIIWMQKMQGMPPLSEETRKVILDYLEKNY